jgi:hypothetical protein
MPEKTCQHCDFQTICRVQVTADSPEAEEA